MGAIAREGRLWFTCRMSRRLGSIRVCWPALAGAGLVAVACTACGSNLLETASLSLSTDSTVHSEKPIDLYTKIARGALTCWFGPNGSLKKTHVFHADTAPEHKGGEVEIVLHQRDEVSPGPRALRAYRIAITRSGDGSQMLSENLKLPEPVAKDMRADLTRWARGDAACSVMGSGSWGPAPSAVASPPTQSKRPAPAR